MSPVFRRLISFTLSLAISLSSTLVRADEEVKTYYRIPLDHPVYQMHTRGERMTTVLNDKEVVITYLGSEYIDGRRVPNVHIDEVRGQVGNGHLGHGGTAGGGAVAGRGSAAGRGAGGSGAPGHSGTGSGKEGFGFGDGLAVGLAVYGTIENIAATAGVSIGQAKALSKFVAAGVDQVRREAQGKRDQAAADDRRSRDRASRHTAGAGRAAGDILAKTKSPGGKASPSREAWCDLSVAEGELPEEYRRALAEKNVAKLAEFVDGILGDSTSSDFCRTRVAEFTNEDQVIHLSRLIKGMPEGPFDEKTFATSILTKEGRDLRQTANRYQSYWAGQNGKPTPGREEIVNSGADLLEAADAAYAEGDEVTGRGLWASSNAILDILTGLKDGAVAELIEAAGVIPYLREALEELSRVALDDARAIQRAAQDVFTSIPSVRSAIEAELIVHQHAWRDLTAYRRSAAVGKVVAMVGQEFLLHHAVTSAVLKGARAAGRITRAVRAQREVRQGLKLGKYEHLLRGQWMEARIDQAALAGKALRYGEVQGELLKEGLRLSPQGERFLASQLANESQLGKGALGFTKGELKATAREFTHFESRMVSAPVTPFKGEATRGIAARYPAGQTGPGVTLEYTTAQVADFPGHSFVASHRYSGPGRTGWYGVLPGPGGSVVEAISHETGLAAGDLIIDKVPVSLSRVLNLGDAATLNHLGVTADQLVRKGLYHSTQALGEAARVRGVEAIIFPSAQSSGVLNIVIF